MKILLLHVYPNKNYRVNKDTNGGYGTANNYGQTFFAKFLNSFTKKNLNWPPISAMQTFSVLRNKSYNITFSNFLDLNYDLYIITSSIVAHETEIETIKTLTKNKKKIISIGPFATNFPNLYIEAGSSVVVGEPEFYFFNNKINLEDLENIKLLQTPNFLTVEDLPYPAWDVLINNQQSSYNIYGEFNKMVPILATRGCPYSCSQYYVYPLQQGKKIRARNPEHILKEIIYWNKNFNVRLFVFRDPVFSINKKHTKELYNVIIKSNIKISFIVETHLNNLSDELSLLLKKAGMIMAKVGIESVNEDVINKNKRFSVKKDEQVERIRFLESIKVDVTAMYIFGYPGDNINLIKNNLKYAKKIKYIYSSI